MKTNMKKIVIAMTVVVIALLVSGCGKNEQEPNLYGYAGQPCQNMMNGFNGYGPYPQVGQNLKGNYPIMGYNGQCYPWNISKMVDFLGINFKILPILISKCIIQGTFNLQQGR